MKAILEFTLPEENEEFKTAQNGANYSIALWDLDQYLRSKLKYEELSEEQHQAYQDIRGKLYELMQERDIDF